MADTKQPDAPGRARPMGEAGHEVRGGDVGGMASTIDGGVQDAVQRRSERRDDDPTGATVGSASTGGEDPRLDLGGKPEPGSAPGASAPDRSSPGSPTAGHPGVRSGAAAASDAGAGSSGTATRSSGSTAGSSTATGNRSASGEAGETVAPNPHEPLDEGPVESLGRAVSEVVTGPVQDRDEHDPDKPPRGY